MEAVILFLLFGGLFFFTGGSIGIIRFPDFYTRLHPAGKLDTAGQMMTLAAAALYVARNPTPEHLLTGAKIGLIVVFVHITSPTATHAIIDAGVRAGLLPWRKKEGGKDDVLAD